ncbi:hypothetical protein B0H13DRAFT_2341026 [Mycena leptocephala]|nr:hypothetical protein B0H13DRAFT_2341026 [Mycena leptocephala]
MPTLQGLQPRNTKKLPKGGAIALIVCITVLCLVIIAIGTYFDRKRAQRRRQAIRPNNGCIVPLIAVRGTLTNYTLDDTFPDIVYTQPPHDYGSFASLYDGGPLPTCHPGSPACFNATSSVNGGSIIVPFTGSAMYVYLGMPLVGTNIGECVFNLDGRQVGNFTFEDEDIQLAFRNTSTPDGPHLFAI